jgi:hypothetical protein
MVGLKIMGGGETETMETRKYSTGTKGRLKMHSDGCKEIIKANSPNYSLATEFITSIDPEREDRVWQRFQSPEDVIPELQEWLGGGESKPTPAPSPVAAIIQRREIKPASRLLTPALETAFQATRKWLESPSGQSEIQSLSPQQAAEATLQKLHSAIKP